jgi:hypothetical protein
VATKVRAEVATGVRAEVRYSAAMRILVIDVGGSHVKLLVSGAETPRRFDSGSDLRPEQVVEGVRARTSDWPYDVVSIGIPSPVVRGAVTAEPWNLGTGWVGFDWEAAFGKPTRVINDAAMQALGSDEGGRMLFLGLGSGLGNALVDEGKVVGLEMGHLPFRDQTFEDYVGQQGLDTLGEAAWKEVVLEVAERLRAAVAAEYVVIGGGNARLFDSVPDPLRLGHNDRAFEGGFRLWTDQAPLPPAWANLRSHAATFTQHGRTLSHLFAEDAGRAARFTLRLDDLRVDFSKTHVTDETMTQLVALARATGVEALRDRMFAGEAINTTEQRAVLHTALRNRSDRAGAGGRPRRHARGAGRPRPRRDFSTRVRSGAWTGYTGARITDVVNIGIGGSDLGPVMATAALAPYANEGPRLHFVSNVDGAHIAQTLQGLDAATTLFVVASKTFTTQETMTNARTARAWFSSGPKTKRTSRGTSWRSRPTPRRCAPSASAPQMFGFWDWVGGRYSLWSSIGLPVALAVGAAHFEAMLDGAFAMDEHFRTAPVRENIPMVLGLLGVWYTAASSATPRMPCCPTNSSSTACPPTCSSSTWRATASASRAPVCRFRSRPARSSGASRGPTASTRSTS